MEIQNNLDNQISYNVEKLTKEYEIPKRQGFPARKRDATSYHVRTHDSSISDGRWRSWMAELEINYDDLNGILGILKHEGLINEFKFVGEYE